MHTEEHTESLAHTQEDQVVEQETTSEQAEQEKEEMERTREKLMQLAREGKKPVLFTPPYSERSLKNLSLGKSQLAALTEKIGHIRTEVTSQSEQISARLAGLKDNPVVTVDSENKQAKESVAQYTALLNRILEEITFEISLLERYGSFEQKTVVPVWANEPSNFDDYIHFKVGMVKKQIKKIERDLSVSFSRYTFSFEKQSKNLENVEALVKYNMRLREAAEKAKNEKGDAAPVAAEAK